MNSDETEKKWDFGTYGAASTTTIVNTDTYGYSDGGGDVRKD